MGATIGYLQNIGADDKNAPTEEGDGINKNKVRKRVPMEGKMELKKKEKKVYAFVSVVRSKS